MSKFLYLVLPQEAPPEKLSFIHSLELCSPDLLCLCFWNILGRRTEKRFFLAKFGGERC